MKNETLYRKTVDILYDAYFNGTLQHNDCWACSTGNIIAANMSLKVEINPSGDNRSLWLDNNLDQVLPKWDNVFCTSYRKKWFWEKEKPNQKINFDLYTGDAANQIKSTGYTPLQLSKMEWAFETANYGKSEEDYMFNGLSAVLEALKQIHEIDNDDIEVGRFRKHYSKLIYS